ncbi:MAG TPA: hypothetical protein VKR61_04595 [Bryobacteraceae bacterium]|nr:hypothetical protein [Bryobacteraceae bacterium]
MRLALGTTLAMFVLSCASPQESAFHWPDARKNGIVLVNANQDLAAYVRNHPDWFSEGEAVLDLSVLNRADRKQAERERIQITDLLRSKGMAAGTYTSGTTAEPLANVKLWPFDKVPAEWLPKEFKTVGSWPGAPERKIMNVADPQSRHALQEGIRRIWRDSPAPIRFVDNAASHSSTGGTETWQAYCANIREIRMIGESMGSRLVFNVSVHPALLSDDDASQLVEAVGRGNGILLEDPWGAGIRKSADLTKQQQARYRQLLGERIAIVMLPVNMPPDVLMNWVRTWRQPSDHLYLGWAFFKKPPDLK